MSLARVLSGVVKSKSNRLVGRKKCHIVVTNVRQII